MNRAPPICFVLLWAFSQVVPGAQEKPSITIDVGKDGRCRAVAVVVSCQAIGAALHELRIPPDTWITFSGDGTLDVPLANSVANSLARAGYKYQKIGFITERTH